MTTTIPTTDTLSRQLVEDLQTVIRNIAWTDIHEAKRMGRVTDSQLNRLFRWASRGSVQSGPASIEDVQAVAQFASLKVFDHLVGKDNLERTKACAQFILRKD